MRATPTAARQAVRARLVARSRPPTLEEISPFRNALVLEEYEPLDGRGTPQARLRVVRWALLNGDPAPHARVPLGATIDLLLEPFESQPQLETVELADTLPPAPGLPLHADVGIDAGID